MAVGKLMLLPVILFLHFGLLPHHVTSSPIPSPPVKIDQRQEGETNVRADLSNIVVVIVPSDGLKLVDTASMGTLIQLFANRRRTAAAANKAPPVPSSPYKVDIEQSAIDKLHADMDSLNSIIPASKTYDDQEEREGGSEIPIGSSLEEGITRNKEQVSASSLEEGITGTKEQVSVSSLEEGITGTKEQVGVSSLEEGITGTKEQVGVSSLEEGVTGTKEQDGASSIIIKEAVEKVDVEVSSTLETTKEPVDVKPETVLKTTNEPNLTGDAKPETVVNKDSTTTMSATTMEAIVTSVNSYSKNGGSESGEKMVKLQPASVTVILAPKKPETSGDVPVRTEFVEIHKKSSSVAPSKDMPSPLSLTIEDLKRPIQVPSEEMSSKSAVKILPKETSKPQQRHHNHQQPKQTKKPVETGQQSSPSPTVSTKTVAAKGAKPEVNSGDHERKLKMLQSGLVFCMPGQKMNEDGECVTATVRQSRRDDMERLLAALRFGVGPANRS